MIGVQGDSKNHTLPCMGPFLSRGFLRFPSIARSAFLFGSTRLCSVIAALDASTILAVGHAPAQAGAHRRPPILTFVRPRRRLTFAPTVGRRGRRAQTMSRLAAVQRPPKARPLHRRARRHAGGVGSIVPVLLLFLGYADGLLTDEVEGSPLSGAIGSHRNLVFGRSPTGTRTMMQSCASGRSSEAADPFFPAASKAMEGRREPPPRTVNGGLSHAY